jgi:hypothetical protein
MCIEIILKLTEMSDEQIAQVIKFLLSVTDAPIPNSSNCESDPSSSVIVNSVAAGVARCDAAIAAQNNDSIEEPVVALPWDKRIHSSSKAVNQNGSFRLMRGVDPELVRSVTEELCAVIALTATDTVTDPAETTLIPPPPMTTNTPVLTFPDVMQRLTVAVTSGLLSQDDVRNWTDNQGLPSLGMLGLRPDMFDQFITDLGI